MGSLESHSGRQFGLTSVSRFKFRVEADYSSEFLEAGAKCLKLRNSKLSSLLHHPQLVDHLEDVRHAVGGNGRQVLVSLAVHVALQRHPLAFHNNVNAR